MSRSSIGGTIQVTKEFTINGEEKEVTFTIEGEWVDNGIGSYEYWGAKGVDHNWMWEWEIVSATIDGHPMTEEELKSFLEINPLQDDDNFCKEVEQELRDKFHHYDAPDREDEDA